MLRELEARVRVELSDGGEVDVAAGLNGLVTSLMVEEREGLGLGVPEDGYPHGFDSREVL